MVGQWELLQDIFSREERRDLELGRLVITLRDGSLIVAVRVSDTGPSITTRTRIWTLAADDAVSAVAAIRDQMPVFENRTHSVQELESKIISLTQSLIDEGLQAEADRTLILYKLDEIEKQTRRLQVLKFQLHQRLIRLSIINDILDFSKIEAGKMEVEVLDFNLRDLIEETTEVMSLHAESKRLELAYYIQPEVPSLVKGDPGRIKQIMINLINNAVKFTSKGSISLSVERIHETGETAWIRISVQDMGPGISPECAENLFKAFSQLDASTTRKHGGTGLGLAISKQLVDLMDGEIGVDCNKAQGAVFWFTLPMPRQPYQYKDTAVAQEAVARNHVLVVDDNTTNRRLLSAYLKKWGCRCALAESGSQALSRIRTAAEGNLPFSIIIIDYMMPEMTGDILGQQIKADPAFKDTHMVLMATREQRRDRAKMKATGFSAFLVKPIKRQDLFHCIARCCVPGYTSDDSPDQGAVLVGRHSCSVDPEREVRILVAEDNPVNQKVAVMSLNKMGYDADIADNGKEAVAAVREFPYDIVFMDMHMPELDGLEATRIIRSDPDIPNPDLPIVALTASAMKEDRERCLDAGMDDYLSKPITPQKLMIMVEKWVTASQDQMKTFTHKKGLSPKKKQA
ncbi:response regulator [Desulfobacter curvatus]|uniref:response regulator n=1 Tax=Desulfobacter curvatus TaxID=2290 RepID=UPI000372E207|nr:response regulator [Desulfobacter curvatus]